MECLEISPCMGWMSSDPERRRFTSERAQNLTLVAEDIVASQKNNFKNFELIYMDYPWTEVRFFIKILTSLHFYFQALENHVAEGGEFWHGIEVTDGFHPRKGYEIIDLYFLFTIFRLDFWLKI